MSKLFTNAHSPGTPPSRWVMRWLGCLPAGARVLDFAAGGGRHALAAARMGLEAVAADLDGAALEGIERAGAGVRTVRADLEAGRWPFEPASFDAVVVANYLFRPRFDLLAGLLAPGGALVYETFARGNERYGRPSNPAFLLAEGELFRACERCGLSVIAYESGFRRHPGPARVQRAFAVRPPVDAERFALDEPAGEAPARLE